MTQVKQTFREKLRIETKYRLNTPGAVIYFVLLAVMLGLIFLHSDVAFRKTLPTIGGYVVYDHMINFIGSYLLVTGMCLTWLLNKISWKYLAAMGLIVMAANIIYEGFIGLANTKDMLDAWAGVGGVFSAWIVLWALARWGIHESKT